VVLCAAPISKVQCGCIVIQWIRIIACSIKYKNCSSSFMVKQRFHPQDNSESTMRVMNIFMYSINGDTSGKKKKVAQYLTRCESSVYSTVLFAEHFCESSVRQHQKLPKTISACVKSDVFIVCCSQYLQMWNPVKYSACHCMRYFITQ